MAEALPVNLRQGRRRRRRKPEKAASHLTKRGSRASPRTEAELQGRTCASWLPAAPQRWRGGAGRRVLKTPSSAPPLGLPGRRLIPSTRAVTRPSRGASEITPAGQPAHEGRGGAALASKATKGAIDSTQHGPPASTPAVPSRSAASLCRRARRACGVDGGSELTGGGKAGALLTSSEGRHHAHKITSRRTHLLQARYVIHVALSPGT